MQEGTLTLVRGDNTDVGVTVNNPDGTPYILSGCSLVFTARKNSWSSAVILTKTTTGHLAPESGLSQFSFVPVDTMTIDDTKHYYDIKLNSSLGTVTTMISGPFYVAPSSTSACLIT